jgi:subtilisin family serine protease
MKSAFVWFVLILCSNSWAETFLTSSAQILRGQSTGCAVEILNPHMDGDLAKVSCSSLIGLAGLSPLANLYFEEESLWVPSVGLKQWVSDPQAGDQWAHSLIGVESYWQTEGPGDAQIVVAIIDTGIDADHEDIRERVFRNAQEIPDNRIDDDHNGFIDDFIGWNSQEQSGLTADPYGHGTHVAGIVGAEPGNGVGVHGLNWNVRLLPVRFIGSNGGGSTESAVRAIDYAVSQGARIINASWGGSKESLILKAAIEQLEKRNVLFVAAAGNESRDNDLEPTYPASFDLPNIISVGSIGFHGKVSDFSNWGLVSVDILAPGESILSTIMGQKYGFMQGTSMASPHVAGAAALLLASHPDWTYRQIKEELLRRCEPLPEAKGQVVCGGYLKL